jgi:AcrR family transcriptional regulator
MGRQPARTGRIMVRRRRRLDRPDGGRSSRARIPGAEARLPRNLAPRKPPRQDRSRALVEAILGAAVDLLSSHGYARTSTNQIAERAGVSVGSLYQYFPNKDAIVTALFERHARDIDQIVETALAEMRRPEVPLRSAFGRMLAGFEALHDSDPKMARAVDPALDGRQQLAEMVRRRQERFRQALAEVLRGRPDVRPGNHDLMASLLFEIADGLTRSLMHGDARRFERGEALSEATEAMCRYIEARPVGTRTTPGVGPGQTAGRSGSSAASAHGNAAHRP